MVIGNPFPLKANAGKSFQGSIVLGKGFVLSPQEAEALIKKDPRNKDVLFPYLNGDDLNNDPEQKPSRWVINFFDWPEEKARAYTDCFEIVERLVKPERLAQNDKVGKEKWWRFLRPRNELYETISQLDQVMVVPLVSKYSCFEFAPTSYVFMHKLGIMAFADFSIFGILSSSIHNLWCWRNSSTLGAGTLNYSTTDCFETFPFPVLENKDNLKNTGEKYHSQRKRLMESTQLGLTKTYNLFHLKDLTVSKVIKIIKQDETTASKTYSDILVLRELYKKLDEVVLESYGWSDLELGHAFYEMDYLPENDKIRFSINPIVRKEILKRLLLLNQKLYEEEIKLYRVSKKKAKANKKTKSINLFSEE